MVHLALLSGLVTVAFPPTPLPQALESLSAAMGERLECAPSLRDEVLLARLKDADGERVLREIAFSLDALWERKGEGRVLRRDPAAAARREAEGRRAREAQVGAALKDFAARLAKQPAVYSKAAAARYRKSIDEFKAWKDKAEFDGPAPTSDFDEDAKPSWRAFARVVAALGARSFLALRPGERVVWSDRPTPMQLPLAPSAMAALGAFRREYALVDPKAVVARFLVIAKNDPEEGVLGVQFVALDARGEEIDGADDALSAPSYEPDEPTHGPKAPVERPLELPDEAKEYLSVVSFRSGAVRGETFRRWEPRLADPVAFEPTRWYPGMAFVAAAEAQGRNLIGTVPDLAHGRFMAAKAETPQGFLESMAHLWTLRDGWIVARPYEPTGRTSRAAAGALFSDAVRRGGLGIDPAADWLARHPSAYADMEWVGAHLSLLLSGGGSVGVASTFNEESLGLWGSLSPSVRAALRNRATIPLGALPAPAQEAVRRKVYWENAIPDEAREITDALPNGIGEGTVSLEVAEEPVFFAWNGNKGEPVSRTPYTAEAYGLRLGLGERRGRPVDFDRFRQGLTRRYRLNFSFPRQRLLFTQEMSETFFDPKAATVESLPGKFLKAADVARMDYLAQPAGGSPGGGTPP